MLTDSSEMKASQALRETLLQPRRSSSEMKERRRRYFRHESVSLLQPGKETHITNGKIKLMQHVCVSSFFVCVSLIGYSHQSLTSQVELCERVSGRRAHCSQQVDGVVGETVAVGEVQFC